MHEFMIMFATCIRRHTWRWTSSTFSTTFEDPEFTDAVASVSPLVYFTSPEIELSPMESCAHKTRGGANMA